MYLSIQFKELVWTVPAEVGSGLGVWGVGLAKGDGGPMHQRDLYMEADMQTKISI